MVTYVPSLEVSEDFLAEERWNNIAIEIEEELWAIKAGFKNFDEMYASQFEGVDDSELC